MSGPPSLPQLVARLRVPDPRLALLALAHELVPGQIEPADRVVALAWATWDLERALSEVALPFRRSARDRLLDGDAAAIRYGPVQLLIEGPRDPEHGRVAAFLGRYGPGLVALYVERPRFLPPAPAAGRPPRPHRTPFGRRGWLLPHDWPWGPFVIALDEERGRRG